MRDAGLNESVEIKDAICQVFDNVHGDGECRRTRAYFLVISVIGVTFIPNNRFKDFRMDINSIVTSMLLRIMA